MNEQQNHTNTLANLTQQIRDDTYDPNQGRGAAGNTEYKKIIKRFKTFVDGHSDDDRTNKLLLTPGKYFSENAVRYFYIEKENNRRCNQETAKRTRNALDRVAREEGCESIDTFTDLTQTIQVVLENLRTRSNERIQLQKDPHLKNPTNIITPKQLSAVMNNILKKNNWRESAVIWAILSNTLMRFCNSEDTTLANLYVFKDLPPQGVAFPHDGQDFEPDDDRHWIFGILISPDKLRKKNNSSSDTEMVGAYRHKQFERCLGGVLAFAVYDMLHGSDRELTFKKVPTHQNEQRLCEFKLFEIGFNGAYKQMKNETIEAFGGVWKKTTHLRYVVIGMTGGPPATTTGTSTSSSTTTTTKKKISSTTS